MDSILMGENLPYAGLTYQRQGRIWGEDGTRIWLLLRLALEESSSPWIRVALALLLSPSQCCPLGLVQAAQFCFNLPLVLEQAEVV